jgi:integrase
MEAVLSLDNPLTRDYFLLVLLTGLRRQEALDLRWEHVDLTGRTLTVTDTKNHQDHTLPLSDYLLEMLTSLKANAEGPYVFESSKGRLQNLRYAMEKVINHSGVEFTIHDLRRTFATVADSLDIPGYAVKALLNHKTGTDVTAGYVVINVERLRDPMQRITDYILKAGGLRAGAEVLNLRKAVP